MGMLLSIPQWSDFNSVVHKIENIPSAFQSHNGLILTLATVQRLRHFRHLSIPQWSDFNLLIHYLSWWV